MNVLLVGWYGASFSMWVPPTELLVRDSRTTSGRGSLFQEMHLTVGQQTIGGDKELRAFLPGSPPSQPFLGPALGTPHPLELCQGDRIGDRSHHLTCVGRWVTWGPLDVPPSSWRWPQMAPVWVAYLSSPPPATLCSWPLFLFTLSHPNWPLQQFKCRACFPFLI